MQIENIKVSSEFTKPDGNKIWISVTSPEEVKTINDFIVKSFQSLEFDKAGKEVKKKLEPDIVILQKYKNAVDANDEKTKKEIEENYNII